MEDSKLTRSWRGPGPRPGSRGGSFLEVGDAIGGRYEVVRLLGSGGMGSVYEVRDRHTQQRAALKLLAPDLCSCGAYALRFAREGRVAATLDHPNLIKVRDGGRHHDRPFLVMDFIEGETLETRIAERRLASFDEVTRIAEQVGAGLDCLHGQGMIHRDIKSANIMVDTAGHATLLDFGVLRDHTDLSLTLDGSTVGTPGYMAPEQALGDKGMDGSADQYALASVVFELLAGRLPFDEIQDAVRVRRQLNEPAPDVRQYRPEVPAIMAEALKRALSSAPEHRFPSASAFAAALTAPQAEELDGGDDIETVDLALPPPRLAPRQIGLVGWATAALILGTALAMLGAAPASLRWAAAHHAPVKVHVS